MQFQALPGFRDFYPAEAALRNHIFDAWRRVARRYGFEEYDGPPIELLGLYVAKSGAEIVEQLYTFVDKGGREVALRPEMTPTLARMVAARAQGLKKPIRWFSIPQLFRYERQQRGRLREHFQLNVDVIGESTPVVDAEIIAVSIDVMRELGLGSDDFRVKLSDREVIRSLVESCGVESEKVSTAVAAIDKVERESNESLVEGMGAAGIGTSEAKAVLEIASIRGTDALVGELTERGIVDVGGPLLDCVATLEDMGLGSYIEIDTSIVRGLAYYTGIVFELFDVQGELRAICGGGRYDRLLADLGSIDLPAAGFGMGDVVLTELLKSKGVTLPDAGSIEVFVAAVNAEDFAAALAVAQRLRQQDIRVEHPVRPMNLGKQLKLAAARGAGYAVVIGPDERAANEVMLRDLSAGDESRVSADRVADRLKDLLRG